MVEDDDGFGGISDYLRETNGPWVTIGGGPGCGVAMLPRVPVFPQGSKEQRALEDAWETSAIEMHKNQKALPPLAAKPTIGSLRGKRRGLYRGD